MAYLVRLQDHPPNYVECKPDLSRIRRRIKATITTGETGPWNRRETDQRNRLIIGHMSPRKQVDGIFSHALSPWNSRAGGTSGLLTMT